MPGWRMWRRMLWAMRWMRFRPNGSPGPMPQPSPGSSTSASPTARPGSRRPSMPDRKAFQYTVLRVVPDVERGERLNVGVVLYSPERKFLGARVHVDRERLVAIAPELDLDALERHLGSPVAGAGGGPGGGRPPPP